jgi:hypothetical protein
MKTTFKKLAIGASLAVSVSVIASAPAHAGSLTGATIGGTAATDYFVYDSNATNTFLVQSTQANVQKVLDGDATKPGGNVELRASTEKATFNATEFTKNTTLTGKIGGKSLTLSSLTSSDWNTSYQGTTFGNYWFNQALSANGLGSIVGTTTGTSLFKTFVDKGGFQRFSDPNISYVNQNDTSGLISIGLAGHYDATNLLLANVPTSLKALLPKGGIQASEIVKYTYNGKTDYLFSFKATKSGVADKSDGISHTGNYGVTIQGIPKKVPEPSAMLGLLGVAGVFASQRKLKLKKA